MKIILEVLYICYGRGEGFFDLTGHLYNDHLGLTVLKAFAFTFFMF